MKAKVSGPGEEEEAAMGEQYQKPKKNEVHSHEKAKQSRAGLMS